MALAVVGNVVNANAIASRIVVSLNRSGHSSSPQKREANGENDQARIERWILAHHAHFCARSIESRESTVPAGEAFNTRP